MWQSASNRVNVAIIAICTYIEETENNPGICLCDIVTVIEVVLSGVETKPEPVTQLEHHGAIPTKYQVDI